MMGNFQGVVVNEPLTETYRGFHGGVLTLGLLEQVKQDVAFDCTGVAAVGPHKSQGFLEIVYLGTVHQTQRGIKRQIAPHEHETTQRDEKFLRAVPVELIQAPATEANVASSCGVFTFDPPIMLDAHLPPQDAILYAARHMSFLCDRWPSSIRRQYLN